MARDTIFRRHPDRREFLTIGVGVFVALSLPASLRRYTPLVRRRIPLMGTIAEIQVAHRDERFAARAIDAAISELRWVESTMTRFRSDSDIGRANLGAGRDGVRVTAQSGAVIATALRVASASDGRFDPAIGAASELWDVLNRHEPPAPDRVRRLAARDMWRKVDVAANAGSDGALVRFNDP
ncbi:MAG: FAD:protein FMN transferase, partial [Gemmatimonadaceae bacterium]|nr:FAD:protein FMN transferase [Gemmatimonadaceae bacterium]